MLSEKKVVAIKETWEKKRSYEYPIEMEQALETCLVLYARMRKLREELRLSKQSRAALAELQQRVRELEAALAHAQRWHR